MHVCTYVWCTDVVRIEKIFLVGVSFYMRKLDRNTKRGSTREEIGKS